MDPINFFVLEMISYRKFKRSAQQEVDILWVFWKGRERERKEGRGGMGGRSGGGEEKRRGGEGKERL